MLRVSKFFLLHPPYTRCQVEEGPYLKARLQGRTLESNGLAPPDQMRTSRSGVLDCRTSKGSRFPSGLPRQRQGIFNLTDRGKHPYKGPRGPVQGIRTARETSIGSPAAARQRGMFGDKYGWSPRQVRLGVAPFFACFAVPMTFDVSIL